jgi:hypothetical protein
VTDKELIEILIKAFLAPELEKNHAGRWDTWLIKNGHIDKFVLLMLKRDSEYEAMVHEAKKRADIIKNSPLHKAML